MRVVFEYPPAYWDPPGEVLGDYMVELLDKLGYRGSVSTLPPRDFYSPGNEFQMALDAWGADYAAVSNFIDPVSSCDASLPPESGFCDQRIEAMIDRASRVQVEDPAASGPLWAKIDGKIVDQAPYLWLVNPIGVGFVSKRVANYQWSIQWGVLLNQLWVQ
jgi:peptide/nickel transport system substrate-binding protein